MDKFTHDFSLLSTELFQVGDIYDESVATNLEQLRMACEHNISVWKYDQSRAVAENKEIALRGLRVAFRKTLRSDTLAAQRAREDIRSRQLAAAAARDAKKKELMVEMKGWEYLIEPELEKLGFPAADPALAMRPEEELVMSFMLRQVEMECALNDDYTSMQSACERVSKEGEDGITDFDKREKLSVQLEGSWFSRHRETIERHASALTLTLTRVRAKVNEGFKVLNAKLEALDFDCERAAEEELAALDPSGLSLEGGSLSSLEGGGAGGGGGGGMGGGVRGAQDMYIEDNDD